MCQISLNSPVKWQLASSFWETCNVNSSVPATHSWRDQKMHCDVCAISLLPFPALFLLVMLDCHTHTHTLTYEQTEKEHVLLRKVGRRSSIRTGNDWEGQFQGNQQTGVGAGGGGWWWWGVAGNSHFNSPWPIPFWVFIHLQTPFPFSESLTFSHFVFTVPGNLALLFTACSRLLDWEWVRVWLCVLEWEDCEKVAAPSSISSPRTTPFLAGGRSLRYCSLPQLARLDYVLQTLLLYRLEADKPVHPGWALP